MNQTKHGQSTGQHDANQLRRIPYELAYESEHREQHDSKQHDVNQSTQGQSTGEHGANQL